MQFVEANGANIPAIAQRISRQRRQRGFVGVAGGGGGGGDPSASGGGAYQSVPGASSGESNNGLCIKLYY